MRIKSAVSPSWRRTAAVLAAVAGLFVAANPATADTITYTYDNLGRLASTYDATTGVTVTYTYDLNGNRMVQVITTNASAGVWGTMVWGSGTWGG
jgi:YD repeat-containing protein